MEPQKTRTRATSYDVARLAGVSQSAVSRCFKPGASVSKKMRHKVMAAAKELNYQPNAIARGLITRRSNLVAVIVSLRMNFYYPEVLFELTDRLAEKGMRVLLFNANNEDDVENHINQIWQYQADGVISASHFSINQHKTLEARDTPVVMFNRYFEHHPSNVVWCDVEQATIDMVSQLVNYGHERFALIEGPSNSMVSRERMRITRDALRAHNLDPIITTQGNYRYESASAAIDNIRKAQKGVTAIIAANDMMAMGAVDELRNVVGLSVPKDVSVVGFDGINAGRFASYELTTVRQPIGRMCEAAISMLMDRIDKPETSVERRVLTGTLLEGTSIGPVKS